MAKLSIRIDLADGSRIGPGKVRLLQAVAEAGSIAAAGRSLGMSYRRAWSLIAELNAAFGRPVVVAAPGGRNGGGAALTPLGHQVLATYDHIQRAVGVAAQGRLEGLERARLEDEDGGAIPDRI